MFMIVLMIFLNLMIAGHSAGNAYGVDSMGHVGGALTGLIWGLAFFPRVENDLSVKLRKIGMGATAAFFLLFIMLLFL